MHKYAATVELELGQLPAVPGFQGELGQVFLNLLVNAAHAVTERMGCDSLGIIRISTHLDGDSVEVRVSDNGSGIAPENRARIFEPFFSTKEVGHGSGQGLAISRSIVVDKHAGALWFDSEPGVGTTFFVRLPLAAEAQCGASASLAASDRPPVSVSA